MLALGSTRKKKLQNHSSETCGWYQRGFVQLMQASGTVTWIWDMLVSWGQLVSWILEIFPAEGHSPSISNWFCSMWLQKQSGIKHDTLNKRKKMKIEKQDRVGLRQYRYKNPDFKVACAISGVLFAGPESNLRVDQFCCSETRKHEIQIHNHKQTEAASVRWCLIWQAVWKRGLSSGKGEILMFLGCDFQTSRASPPDIWISERSSLKPSNEGTRVFRNVFWECLGTLMCCIDDNEGKKD